ncbi:cation diffusion facilitator family transporter [Gulosibacter molinativorax]|uniref:Cation transporter n=1 Tax=Gulosibacter molinativorax TaxID=256821 RepID=A0ABT7C7Y1_9MICO|nr:cation diffusion facilitator family transporter [Gulosibacter molinativorax]MDJ1371300.1 cation transporter [Gulosibacter molinativorax]QUY63636.1 Predicted Co/Zn/Cd cation transporters [Gulosibacter molinativorax]
MKRLPLPDGLLRERARAIRLQWISLTITALSAALVFSVAGNSQAMKAAWVEDALSLIPPIAFLISSRVSTQAPTQRHPYGFHRSVGVGHLIASVALTAMALILIYESASALLAAEHPTIGSVELFGVTLWQGWLMIGAMILTGWPPVVLGHIKLKYARKLHDKILYADAEMNKADWQTATGSIFGILGIGLGLWWLDATVALLIAGSILKDGVSNLRASLLDLMDKQARTHDDAKTHPLVGDSNRAIADLPWVKAVGSRVRDEGHELHLEAFVVPKHPKRVSIERLEEAREACQVLDWKLRDVVIVPVRELPEWVYSRQD